MLVASRLAGLESAARPATTTPAPGPAPAKSLLIVLHAFNVDGASMMAVVAMQSARFREQFSKITVVATRGGCLEKVLRRVPGVVHDVVPWGDTDVPPAKLVRHLLAHETVWVNSFDHPPKLFEALEKLGSQGLVFGHESMHADSLFRSNIDFGGRKLEVIKRLMRAGRFRTALPSASTRRFAAEHLMPEVGLLPYGIDTEFAAASPAAFDTLGTVRFIAPSWLCERKNQAVLVPVFKRLLERERAGARMRDWTLTFAGTAFGAGHYRHFIERAVAELPADRLSFYSMMSNEEMRELLCGHHVVIFPSYNEALPVTVMEAMAGGRVVVGSDCEGCDELIRDGENGFQFRRGDVAGLYRAVERILSPALTRPDELARLGEAARASLGGLSLPDYCRRLVDTLGAAKRTYRTFAFADATPTKTHYDGCGWPAVNEEYDALMAHPPCPAGGEEPARLVLPAVDVLPGSRFRCYVHLPRPEATRPVRFTLDVRQGGAVARSFAIEACHEERPTLWEADLDGVEGVCDLELFTVALESHAHCTAHFIEPQLQAAFAAGGDLAGAETPGQVIVRPAPAKRFGREVSAQRIELPASPAGSFFEATAEVQPDAAPAVRLIAEIFVAGRLFAAHRVRPEPGAAGAIVVRIPLPAKVPASLQLRAEWADSRRGEPAVPTWWGPRVFTPAV